MKRLMIIITISVMAFTACSKDIETEKKDISSEIYNSAGLSKRSNSQQAPDFTLTNIKGETVSLFDYKDQVVVLNFWASWCGPCIGEMPSIESLYQQTKDLDIKILAVNVGESADSVKTFIDKNSYTFETLVDSQNSAATIYGIRSIPMTYIIDKNGIVVSGKLGSHEWDNPKIIEILKELAE